MFCFSRLITQVQIWKSFELKIWHIYFTSLPTPSLAETWKIIGNMLYLFFFAYADILSEKNHTFGKQLYFKTRTDYTYKLHVQDFATGKNFSFKYYPKQRALLFSQESYFIQGFWYFARSWTREIQVFPRNPAKFPKKCEIPRNPPEISPNTCRKNIFNTYLGY